MACPAGQEYAGSRESIESLCLYLSEESSYHKEPDEKTNLDEKRDVLLPLIHPIDHHPSHLAGDSIIRDAELNSCVVEIVREETQKVVVDLEQVSAVLPGILQPPVRDLGKRAGAVETADGERVQRGLIDLPERGGTGMAWDRLAIVIPFRVITVPRVPFDGKGIGLVGGSLVMAMDLRK